MQLKANTELQNGKYRIIRILGQGGFGITYLAEHTYFDRLVAIKEFFPKDFCGRDETSHLTLGTQNNAETVTKLKARFLKEARNIAKLDHPGIVKIHDIFEENNTAYYVMDYIEGENLNDMVKRNGPLPEEKAVEYIGKVGEALEYIHSRNMTHFDVKPANIVVRRSDDTPILIDFGLSKQYDVHGDATSTLLQGISQGYSPIEMYNSGSVSSFSPQTDVYSLGATLYYLVTGKVPPAATDLIETKLSLPDNISSKSKKAITGAMTLSKNLRTNSVMSLVENLSSFMETDSSKEETMVIGVANPKDPNPDSSSNNPNEVSDDGSTAPDNNGEKNHDSNISKIINWVLGIGLLIGIGGIIYWSIGNENQVVDTPLTNRVNKVVDLTWNSPLGFAVYNGEVKCDTLSDGTISMIPNGTGKAVLKTGKHEGAIYDGEFKNGVFDGFTVYTLSGGDRFEGTFRDNHYEEGKYIIKDSGEYFVGSFKNGQPYKGNWYSKNGEFLEAN